MEVANFLNFSRAAERLRITQPAVSHQISTLEDELGVKLFHRTSKSVRLTPAGDLFTQYAGEILKLSRLSKARIKEPPQSEPPRLVIGCRNPTELHFLTPALARLRQELPEVLPVLRLIPFDALETLLAEGDIHMMFAFREAASAKSRYRELARCPAVCVCAPTHPLAGREALTVEALREGGRMAVFRPRVYPPSLFALQSQAVGNRETSQVLACDNLETLLPLVASGYAFAVTADIPHSRLPDLRYIPVPEIEPLSFGAVYTAEGYTPLIRAFLGILSETSAQRPAP